MKPAPFAYVRPSTVDDVLAELGRDEAKVLAGGQSLVPVLAMRLARPATLVDINAVAGLDRLERGFDALHVGATVRQRRLHHDPASVEVPLLRLALPWIGHRELRSRGTVCGSLAHADPAAELPAVARCLDATLTITGPQGKRSVPAGDFFTAAMTTVVQPDELLLSAAFPLAGPDEGFGFGEVARRHGDFALAGVAVRVHAGDPHQPAARVVCFGVADGPVVRDAGAMLADAVAVAGTAATEQDLNSVLAGAAADLATDVVDTAGDAHGSPGYRRRLVAGLAARELARAYRRATGADT
ncbi:MAG: FAD binding domain-containing protein [Ilumatobacteraceae bacterium]